MGNGSNEPVQFTRGDAERLGNIEIRHNDLHKKMDLMAMKIDVFLNTHRITHKVLETAVGKNSRFRRTFMKITLYVLSPSGVIMVVAKAFGWF